VRHSSHSLRCRPAGELAIRALKRTIEALAKPAVLDQPPGEAQAEFGFRQIEHRRLCPMAHLPADEAFDLGGAELRHEQVHTLDILGTSCTAAHGSGFIFDRHWPSTFHLHTLGDRMAIGRNARA
jgi:hypothetical protein